MKLRPRLFAVSSTFLLLLIGCSDPGTDSGTTKTASVNDASSGFTTDKWLGQWNGPEGTFLLLTGGNGTYEITIQNLDGPQTYQGSAAGDQIRFVRNGVQESIHATNGTETGMKWLTDKSNCLTVHSGEGYCRD